MAQRQNVSIMSRTKISDMKIMATNLNLTLPSNTSREVLGAFVYLASKGVILREQDGSQYQFVKPSEANWHRFPIADIKRAIHERVSGTNSVLSNELMECLKVVHQRDALVSLLLILDKEGVPRLPLDENASSIGQPLRNVATRDRVLNLMLSAVKTGLKPGVTADVQVLPRRAVAATRFLRFMSFHKEIRLMIWQAAAKQDSRIIKLHTYKNVVKTTCPPPAVLHACYESRIWTIHFYKKVLADNQDYIYTPAGHVPNPHYFFVNLELDTIVLGLRHRFMNHNEHNNVGLIPSIMALLPDFLRDGAKHIALSRDALRLHDLVPHNIGRIVEFRAMESFTWIQGEVMRFVPHHVELRPLLGGIPLKAATRTELTAAFLDDNRVINPMFSIKQVTEELFGV